MYPLHQNDTGSFQELAHASDVEFGQLSLLTVNPRCKRGGHYHTHKKEWFCCVRGECYLVATDIRTKNHKSFFLDANCPEFMPVNPYESHTVLNPNDTTCGLLVISSEEYDPDNPDTIKCRTYPDECEVHGVTNCQACGGRKR